MWQYNYNNPYQYTKDTLYHSDAYLGEEFTDELYHWKYIDKIKTTKGWRYIYKLKDAYKNGKSKKEILTTQLNKKNEKCSESYDLKAVNPKYDGGFTYAYSNNCGPCAIAFDLRRRGYDVESKPAVGDLKDGMSTNEILKCYKNAKVVLMIDSFVKNTIKNKKIESMKESFKNDIISQGKNTSGIISVRWKTGGGHFVNYKVTNNKIVVMDSQSNEYYDIDELLERVYNAGYIRTDNLKPLTKCTSYVRNRKKDNK